MLVFREADWLSGNMWSAFWMALVPSAILAYPILLTLIRMKSRQTVSQYAPEGHQIKQGTPTMGGLIVAVGFLISAGLGGFRGGTLLIPFIGFLLIGLADDFLVPRFMKGKRGLGWKQKILLQFAVAVFAAWDMGRTFQTEALYVFLVLFFSNAYNFADGLDGLAGTLGVLLFGAMAAIGFLTGYSDNTAIHSAAMVGALIPFLFLNAPPARVFMGDVGSLPVGALLGAMVFQVLAPWGRAGMFDPASEWYQGRPFVDYFVGGIRCVPTVAAALLVLSLVMVAELVPVPLQIASVKLLKRKLFPYTPIHHAFERAGWPETRVVFRFALTQLILCVAAVAIVLGAAIDRTHDDPRIRTAVNRP